MQHKIAVLPRISIMTVFLGSLAHGAPPSQPTKDLNQELVSAVAQGQTEAVRSLLKASVDVNAKDTNARTVLMLAAEKGQPEIVTLLLTAGADVHAGDWAARTALMEAAEKGHGEIVGILLRAGADAKAKDAGARTVLMLAAEKGRTDIVQTLLASKVPVNEKDDSSQTTLMHAVEKGQDESVALLLQVGADVNVTDRAGRTALALITTYPELVEILIQAGAVEGSRLERELLVAAATGNSAHLSALLKTGAQPNVRDREGKTALMHVATTGRTNDVRLLLRAGADVHIRDTYERTALMWAAENGHSAVGDLLLQAGAEPKDRLSVELLQAATAGNTDRVAALLTAGADVHARDADGKTPLMRATEQGDIPVLSLLLKAGSHLDATNKEGTDALSWAVQQWRMDLVETLTARSPPQATQVETALLQAAVRGEARQVASLIQAGARVDANQSDKTALHWAGQYGHLAVVQTLLTAGADVNATDAYGTTALMETASAGHTAIVQALLKAGANANRRDYMGETALLKSGPRASVEVTHALLQAGADVNARNRSGESALMRASRHPEVARLLIRAGASQAKTVAGDFTPPNEIDAQALQRQAESIGFAQSGNTEEMMRRTEQEMCVATYGEEGQERCYRDQPVGSLQASMDAEAAYLRRGIDLPIAAHAGRVSEALALIRQGAPLNSTYAHTGKTALMIAAEQGHTDLVSALLAAGARMDLRGQGSTALTLAAINRHQEIVRALIAGITDERLRQQHLLTAVKQVVSIGKPEPLRILLEHGADVKGWRGVEALQVAASRGNTEVAQLLIHAGVQVNNTTHPHQETPLMLAARSGNSALVRTLLASGADVQVMTASHETALRLAAQGGHAETVSLLLQAGADPNARNDTKGTPLMAAVAGGHKAIVQTLIAAGAEVNASGPGGPTVWRAGQGRNRKY
jgi:ankyrin repeat protein